MLIGYRLKELREAKKLSQGDIENRTGLLRCYVSRVENGHTVPAMETLEKFARALGIPMYQLFYDGDQPPEIPKIKLRVEDKVGWGSVGQHARYLAKLRRLLARMNPDDRYLLMHLTQKLNLRKG